MKSVWLCSRNDAIGNVAVIGAGAAVYYTQSMWPDLIVAGLMAYLGLSASAQVIRAALSEFKGEAAPASCKKVSPIDVECQGS